jgi:two-component sensor histidine kinase
VELHEDYDRTIKLKVSDDGIGISPDFDVSNAKSLGLQLVNNLARQLDATVELSLNGGTSFLISFRY